MKVKSFLVTLTTICLLLSANASLSSEHKYKVLVVMSYEKNNPWCQEIKEGIETVLGDSSQISYVYMDTKINFAGGQAKADHAYKLYNQLLPDGVITVDDNAQSMFAVPYLSNKVKTPTMFCGVNAEAEKYGFPSSNVSGSLERGHVKESIAFMKQLTGRLDNICFMVKKSPSGDALAVQVEKEKQNYQATVRGFYQISSTQEIEILSEILNKQCDAIYIDSLEGTLDKKNKPLSHKKIFAILTENYLGPIIGANKYHVDQGALSAVVKTGQEQGEAAATLLLKAMQGTPVADLPITKNYRGRRIINVSTMEKLKIKANPMVLRSASLVKTEQ